MDLSYKFKTLPVYPPFSQNQTLLAGVGAPLRSVYSLHVPKEIGPKVKNKRVGGVQDWMSFFINELVDAKDGWVKLGDGIVGAKGGCKRAGTGFWVGEKKNFVDLDAYLGWQNHERHCSSWFLERLIDVVV